MHGLISLYLGYIIYLIIFFRVKKRDSLYKKVTILLGIKLLLLTAIYLVFFSDKMTKEQRQSHIENLIIEGK
jgi:hypothetical protein